MAVPLIQRGIAPSDVRSLRTRTERWWTRHRYDLWALALFAVARLVDAVFLAVGGRRQAPLSGTTQAYHVFAPTPAGPDLLGTVTNWDGQWYHQIAATGYPSALPTADGAVVQNAWAFYPGYPLLCRLLMWLLGVGFPLAAVIVSLTAGAIASVLLHRLLRDGQGAFTATAAVLSLNAYAAAPVLGVAYPEALALALVLASLLALRQGRYLVLCLSSLCLGLTRPISLPLAVVVTLVVALRLGRGRLGPSERRGSSGAALAAVAASWAAVVLWPAIAGVSTRAPAAYLETQLAWPVNGGIGAHHWQNWLWQGSGTTPASAVAGALAVLAVLAVALRPATARWGLELRAWALAYPLFLLLATRPGPSVVRLLLPAAVIFWPFPDDPSQDESPAQRRMRYGMLATLVTVGVVCQYLWVTGVFTIDVAPTEQPYP